MNQLLKSIKGDRLIWAIAVLLAILSFLPVYSASSNLAYAPNGSNTFTYFIKHFMHLFLGFVIMYSVHKIPYSYFKGLSIIMIPVILVLLTITIFQGKTIDGANASRWLKIPIVNMTFQTSSLASVVLMVYVARYLSRIKDKVVTFQETILPLWLPVFLVLGLILPANFSTTAIIFTMVLMLTFIGGYPIRYLMIVLGTGLLALTFFILIAKAFPESMPNRVDTWMSRIDNFMSDDKNNEANYQVEKAKIAIATGIEPQGPGKSMQKNLLPQSSSDFIFAIVIEEYGIYGGVFLIILYCWLLFRLVIVSQKSETIFGKLVVLGVGIPIVFQALINMAVAVGLFPVTGQTLPLISSGGTSIWMTCLAIGIILSVSAKREAIIKEQEESQQEQNPLDILSEAL